MNKNITKMHSNFHIISNGSDSVKNGFVAVVPAKNIIDLMRQMGLEQVDEDNPMTFLYFKNDFCEVFDIWEANDEKVTATVDEVVDLIKKSEKK